MTEVLSMGIQKIKTNFQGEYWISYILYASASRSHEMLSPFASPSQELGFLPDVLQKENLSCEAVQRSYVCTACERHKSSVLLSPLLDLSLVQKFIVLQGCSHSVRWEPQRVASHFIVFPVGEGSGSCLATPSAEEEAGAQSYPHPSHQLFIPLQSKPRESLKA